MEEAIVAVAVSGLPPKGHTVSISDVTKVFPNTAANCQNHSGFKCKNCGVPCLAIVPAKVRAGRRRSQRPYFRAVNKHAPSCVCVVKSKGASKALATGSARPAAGTYPSVWRRSSPSGNVTGSDDSGGSVSRTGTTSGEAGGSGRGSGSSKKSSSLVEEFAQAWLNMSDVEKATRELIAPWNPGKTYSSAFHVIADGEDVATLGDRIFVGDIEKATSVKSGWVVSITAKATGSRTIDVWITTDALNSTLISALQNANQSPSGLRIFAFGSFRNTRMEVYAHSDVWVG